MGGTNVWSIHAYLFFFYRKLWNLFWMIKSYIFTSSFWACLQIASKHASLCCHTDNLWSVASLRAFIQNPDFDYTTWMKLWLTQSFLIVLLYDRFHMWWYNFLPTTIHIVALNPKVWGWRPERCLLQIHQIPLDFVTYDWQEEKSKANTQLASSSLLFSLYLHCIFTGSEPKLDHL